MRGRFIRLRLPAACAMSTATTLSVSALASEKMHRRERREAKSLLQYSGIIPVQARQLTERQLGWATDSPPNEIAMVMAFYDHRISWNLK